MTTLSPHTVSISSALPKLWSSLVNPWSLRPNDQHRLDSVSVEHSLGRQAQLCPTLAWETQRSQGHSRQLTRATGRTKPKRKPFLPLEGVHAHTALESWEAAPCPGVVSVVLRLSVEFSTHIWTLPEGPHLRDQALFSFVWICLKCHCISESAPEKQNQ